MKINKIEDIRETFQDFSDKIIDHRINRNKLHPVSEILFLVLCAMICGSEGWRDIERYGKSKLAFLQDFFEYKHETSFKTHFSTQNYKFLQAN